MKILFATVTAFVLIFTTLHLPANNWQQQKQPVAQAQPQSLNNMTFRDVQGKPLSRQEAATLLRTGMYMGYMRHDEHNQPYTILKKYRNTPQKRVTIPAFHP